MRLVIVQLLSNLLKRKSLQISIFVVMLSIGVFATLSYQNFLYLQAQNISQLSLFNEIIKPLSGLVLLAQLFLISITASQLTPYFNDRGQQGLMRHANFSGHSLIGINLVVLSIFSLIPLAYFCLISLSYLQVSDIDSRLIVSTGFALVVGGFLFSLLILSVTFSIKRPLTALIFSLCTILIVFGVDEFLRNQMLTQFLSIYLDAFIHLRDGLIVANEMIQLILWLLFFYAIVLLNLQRLQLLSKLSGIYLLAVSLLLISGNGFLNNISKNNDFKTDFFNTDLLNNVTTKKWDISRKKSNSLNDDFASKISKINVPIKITAVIDDEKNHDEIRQAFEVIQHYHPDTRLIFTSRQSLANQSSMVDQFISIQIAEQQQSIRYPFDRNAKDAISRLILQLTSRNNQWISFIEGHDEATPFGQSGRDIGLFFQSLKQLGWPVAMQNLSKQPVISQNTKVLVIADSRKQWLVGELDGLMNYLKGGGNLLLMREAQDKLPEELLTFLAINTEPGTLIDWQGYQSGTPHPAILIVNQFDDHPVMAGINSLIAFPWSQGLKIDPQKQKTSNQYQTIIQTHKGVWSEFNSEQVELSFDADIGELRQPFHLAFSINNKNNGQRIIVIGDSSFLSDSAINNYANQQFALNLISWLSSQNFEIQQQKNRDSFVRATPTTHFIMSWLFSLILPLIFASLIIIKRFKSRRLALNSSSPMLGYESNLKNGLSDE